MPYNYQGAIEAGYTPDEVDQYLNKGQGNPQPQNNGGFLSGILNAARGFGLGGIQDVAAPLAMGAEELGQGYSPIAGVGKQAPLNVLQNDAKNNIFANQQQLQKMGGTFPQAAKQVAQDTAGAASYMLPFGRGANILTKALLPGAASGVLQGMSDPNANAGSLALNGATGMAGGAIGHGIGALIGKAAGALPKAGNAISNAADPLLRSQYNVSPTISRDLSLPEATQTLAQNFGITNKDQATNIANQFIPLMTDIRNKAIKALPATDLGNINHVINDALQPAVLLNDATRNNFLNHVKSTLNYSADGTNIVDNNPQKVMYGISQLENEAHVLSMSKDPAAQQLATAYKKVSQTMEDRLGNGYINPDSGERTAGINGVPIRDLLTTQDTKTGVSPLDKIYAMNPQLGMYVESHAPNEAGQATGVQTIRQLRHTEAPFVAISRASQAAEDAKMHNTISPWDVLTGLGMGHYISPYLTVPAMLSRTALNSNIAKSTAARGTAKLGGALQRAPTTLSPLLQRLLSAGGARGASAITNAAQQ